MTDADESSLVVRFADMLSSTPFDSDQTMLARASVLLLDQLVLTRHAAEPDDRTVDERAAARAFAGAALDRDDVHWGQLVHPGAIVWSAVVELAAECGSSGIELMRAARIGYETMVRLAALFPPASRSTFHISAVVGPAAAAAAASALLTAGGRVSAHALGHALSVAGGSSGAMTERSGTRRFHRAHAVRTGLAAARAAAAGLEATAHDLENGGGVLAVADRAEPGILLAGDQNALAESSLRLFPASGWFQCAYEASLLAAQRADGPISRIVVAVPASVAARSLTRGKGEDDTWDSLEGSVAHAICRARGDQTVAALGERIVVDPARDSDGAHVSIHGAGTASSADVHVALGHPSRPETMAHRADAWGLSVESAEAEVSVVRAALDSPRPFSLRATGGRRA